MVEWGYAYNLFEIPMNYVFDIEEVEDGYILVGANESTGDFWLVKITKFGETKVNAVNENEEVESVKLYPNPVEEVLTLQFPSAFTGELNIYNSQQQMIFTRELNGELTLYENISTLNQGIYFLQLTEVKTRNVQFLKMMKV